MKTDETVPLSRGRRASTIRAVGTQPILGPFPAAGVLAVAAIFLVVSLGELGRWGGSAGVPYFADGGWIFAAALALAACAHTARRVHGNDRLVWAIFAIGCASWLAGQFAWTYDDFLGSFPSSPTWYDAGYLGFGAAIIVGLVAIGARGRSTRLLLALDIAIVAVVFSILCLTLFHSDLAHSPLSAPARATALLYPISNATLTVALLLLPLRRTWRTASIRLLLLGLLGQVVPWIVWTHMTLLNSYVEGTPLDLLWMVSLFSIAASALVFDRFPAVKSQSQVLGPLAMIPLVLASLVTILVVATFVTRGSPEPTEVLLIELVAAIVVLTCVRLVFTLRSSKRLLSRAEGAAHALRDSEERFRVIFERAPIAMEIADMEGRLVATNHAAQSMLGYTAQELDGMHWTQVSHPDDVAQEDVLDELLVSGEIDHYQIECRAVRKGGSLVWTRQTVSEVRNSDGEAQFAVAMVEDITERRQAEEQLKYQALHDALTGLPNRTLFEDRLDQAILATHRGSASLALLLLDLNRFKEVNDTLGHHVGDVLLQEVALRLRHSLRQSDTVARLGGDEFAVILSAVDERRALSTAAKLQQAFRQTLVLEGHRLDLAASIGIAICPDHGDDASTLLRHADVAMYAAKRSGKDQCVYTPDHDLNSPSRLALVADLRHAIEHEELELHYQPKVNLNSGYAEHTEALVRWSHPDHGYIAPADFIPLAESTGLIGPLTFWVLKSALGQCAAWHKAGLDIKVAVNLSSRSLHDPTLPNTVSWMLRSAQVNPSALILEITESSLMIDPEGARAVLVRLHDMGVKLAIDDFGTGYSSLAYLKELPIDEIKIDKSFVQDMTSSGAVIVRSVIDLGRNLDMAVTAEGVEDEETLAALRQMHCVMAQGYHFCAPVRAERATSWIREHVTTNSAIILPRPECPAAG